MLGLTAECAAQQQISCSVEPRMLIPLSRLTDPYNALRRVGKSMERVWDTGAPATASPARTSRPEPCAARASSARSCAPRLPGSSSGFASCCARAGSGSHRHRNLREPKDVSGARRLGNILRARERHGLNLPYGTYAVEAGFVPDRAPPPADQTGPPDDTASNEAEPPENLHQ